MAFAQSVNKIQTSKRYLFYSHPQIIRSGPETSQFNLMFMDRSKFVASANSTLFLVSIWSLCDRWIPARLRGMWVDMYENKNSSKMNTENCLFVAVCPCIIICICTVLLLHDTPTSSQVKQLIHLRPISVD